MKVKSKSVTKKKGRVNTSSEQLVFRQIPILNIVHKSKKDSKFTKELFKRSPDTVRALSSIAVNILNGNLLPKGKLQKELAKYNNKKQLEQLAAPGLSIKKKVDILNSYSGQHGGFLPLLGALIPPAIGLISSLIGGRKRD